MFCHDCEKHRSIISWFFIDIAIPEINILEHQPGKPGIAFILPLAA